MFRFTSVPSSVLALALLSATTACKQDVVIASNCIDDDCAQGEALLTLTGSVEIERDPERGSLAPALAFFNAEASRFHIADVEVEGQFPSQFTIRVHEPPPDEALVEGPGGQAWALGYLTAVEADHPQSLGYALQTGGMSGCWKEGDEGWATSGATTARPCEHHETWCTVLLDACYSEKRWCPEWGSPFEACEVTWSEGDPELRNDPWDAFAGLSEDLVVVYLSEGLSADDPAGRSLDHIELGAGYHLMEFAKPDEAERRARDACEAEVRELVTDRFNEEHGTDFRGDQLPGGLTCASEGECEKVDALLLDLAALMKKGRAELWCPPQGVALHVVDLSGPDGEGISVRIGTDVNPLGTPYGGAPPRIEAPPPPTSVPPPPAEE